MNPRLFALPFLFPQSGSLQLIDLDSSGGGITTDIKHPNVRYVRGLVSVSDPACTFMFFWTNIGEPGSNLRIYVKLDPSSMAPGQTWPWASVLDVVFGSEESVRSLHPDRKRVLAAVVLAYKASQGKITGHHPGDPVEFPLSSDQQCRPGMLG